MLYLLGIIKQVCFIVNIKKQNNFIYFFFFHFQSCGHFNIYFLLPCLPCLPSVKIRTKEADFNFLSNIWCFVFVASNIWRFYKKIESICIKLHQIASNDFTIIFSRLPKIEKVEYQIMSNIFYFWKISEQNEIENIKYLMFAIFSRFSKMPKNIIVKTFDTIWYFYKKQHFSSIYCVKIKIA